MAPRAVTLSTHQSDGATCGNNFYDPQVISDAVNQGCYLYQTGDEVGKNDYSHNENNYDDLDFNVAGPYQEFPIMADGNLFDGSEGSGADRVVFADDSCTLAGVVTHTGAGGNNFLLCGY